MERQNAPSPTRSRGGAEPLVIETWRRDDKGTAPNLGARAPKVSLGLRASRGQYRVGLGVRQQYSRWALARVPALQLSPTTDDEAIARQWFIDYRAPGVEGLVVQGSAQQYRPSRRERLNVKSRSTQEVIIGAVTGPLTRPDTSRRAAAQRRLVIVGKSVPLSRGQAASLAKLLDPGRAQHPWPDEVSSSRFGSSRDKVKLTKVGPNVVAEILADSALQAGLWRHPLRFVRHRPDLTPAELAALGE